MSNTSKDTTNSSPAQARYVLLSLYTINELTLTLTLTVSEIADDKGKGDAGSAAEAGTAESS